MNVKKLLMSFLKAIWRTVVILFCLSLGRRYNNMLNGFGAFLTVSLFFLIIFFEIFIEAAFKRFRQKNKENLDE